MTDISRSSEASKRGRSASVHDALIVIAMALVAVAIGIGLSLHLGLPAARAAIAGAILLALMLSMHFIVLRPANRSANEPDLSDEAMWQALKERRSETANDSNKPELSPLPAASSARTASGQIANRASKIVAPAATAETSPPSLGGHGQSPLSSDTSTEWRDRIAAGLRGTVSDDAEASPDKNQGQTLASEEPALTTADVPHDDAGSFWTFRPTRAGADPSLPLPAEGARPGAISPNEPDFGQAKLAAPDADHMPPSLEPTAGQPKEMPSQQQDETHREDQLSVTPRQHDVEMVQRMIKKLAEDVNAAELLAKQSLAANPSGDSAAKGLAASDPALGVDSSLEALRKTSAMMRASTTPAANGPATAAPSASANKGGTSLYRHIKELEDAIDEHRLAVLLEPVMGLEDHRARHYEVTVKVQSASGSELQDEAANQRFAGSGLLPKFDRERLAKTKAVATTLRQRGKSGGVFAKTFAESLTDREFCFNVAAHGISDDSFAKRLIMTFPQSVARTFAPAQWQTLHEFRELGFRFALTDVTDLDIDFERLVAAGFAFVKLDADVFFNGLHLADDGFVPAQDICSFLSGLGLSVIVEGINSSETLSELFDNGVIYGQGQLFGGPRTIKADALAGSGHEAA